MTELRDILIQLWTTDIPKHFTNGYITYERQLQAEVYHCMRSQSYQVWIEPVINIPDYKIYNLRPDMVITKKDLVEAIIEIKCCPWQYPQFYSDLKKLEKFDLASTHALEMTFGWPAVKDEKSGQYEHIYKLTPDHLNVFMVIGKAESDAFHKPLLNKISNFLLLSGYIDGADKAPFFDAKF